MKFAIYEYAQGPSFGAVIGNDIVDLSDAGPSLRAVLASGPLGNLQAVAAKRKPTMALDHVVLLQVIPDASRVICVRRNYRDHVTEMGNALSAPPTIFCRPPSPWSATASPSSAPALPTSMISRASSAS